MRNVSASSGNNKQLPVISEFRGFVVSVTDNSIEM